MNREPFQASIGGVHADDLPASAIGSVDNALRILVMLREREDVRVTDVSAALGVSPSTAHRLLLTLSHRGFAQQERRSRSYRAGPALVEFEMSGEVAARIRSAVRPWLPALVVQLGETANVLVLEGDKVRFIDSLECDREPRIPGRTGIILPASATAGGKVLLAELEPGVVADIATQGLRRLTGGSMVDRRSFVEELADIRRQGYAINREESLEGLTAVAVAVRDSSDRAVAALAASVPSVRGQASRLRAMVATLDEYAARIGSTL